MRDGGGEPASWVRRPSDGAGSRILRGLARAVALVAFLLLAWINLALHRPSSSPAAPSAVRVAASLSELRDLRPRIEGGAERMRALFPEGFVFTHALHGLAWTELALARPADAPLRAEALEAAARSLDELESPGGWRGFDRDLRPAGGVFLRGWSNLLRAGVVALELADGARTDRLASLDAECDTLAALFRSAAGPFPESYRQACWPADALPALLSLRRRDGLLPAKHDGLLAGWVAATGRRLDPDTGLLPHAARCGSGEPDEAPRGASQMLGCRLLFEIDSAFAADQYRQARALFLDRVAGVAVMREFPRGTAGRADADSGPVVFGAGAAACVVAVGTAALFGDRALSAELEQLIDGLGLPISAHGRTRYGLGVLPLGEAFLAWSRLGAARSADDPSAHATRPPWTGVVHGLSALLAAAGLAARRRARDRRGSA